MVQQPDGIFYIALARSEESVSGSLGTVGFLQQHLPQERKTQP
ncbi:hypothetical protein [Burkholderia gladioli]|nr:hypothetical protein [Burkholderia gladioli]